MQCVLCDPLAHTSLNLIRHTFSCWKKIVMIMCWLTTQMIGPSNGTMMMKLVMTLNRHWIAVSLTVV